MTTAEVGFLLRKGQEWGLYSASVIKDAAAAQAEVGRYVSALNNIPGHINTVLELRTIYGDEARVVSPGGGRGSQRASGGRVMAGQSYWVGERGPEPFIPDQSGTILPTSAVRMGGGGGSVFNFNYSPGVSLGSKAEIMAWVEDGVRKMQSEGKLPTRA